MPRRVSPIPPRRPSQTLQRFNPFMRNLLIAMYLLSLLGFARAADFSEGQVWSYKARAGEEDSKLLINKIESHPKVGQIFHISISGVRVKNSRAPSGVTTNLPHFPVSKKTLDESVTKLVAKSKVNPEYLEGYGQWKPAFDNGDAGIFSISVQEIVDVIEKAVNQ